MHSRLTGAWGRHGRFVAASVAGAVGRTRGRHVRALAAGHRGSDGRHDASARAPEERHQGGDTRCLQVRSFLTPASSFLSSFHISFSVVEAHLFHLHPGVCRVSQGPGELGHLLQVGYVVPSFTTTLCRAHQRERLADAICVRSDPLCVVYAKENDKWKEVGRTEIIWVSPSAVCVCVCVLHFF